MTSSLTPPLADARAALAGASAHILRIPLENIANLAKEAFDKSAIIPLWFGEGDVPAPPFVGEAAARAIQAGHVFYTHQNGIPELRQALADYLSALNRNPISADRITVTSGGMNAISLAVQLITEKGDNIVVINPVWPNIGGITQILDAEVRPVSMDLGPDGWVLDLAKVVDSFDHRTRAVFFASPGNPTGAMIPIGTQIALLELCRKRGIWIIADEVYSRLVFGRRNAESILDSSDPEDRVIIVNSFSKSWAMTGWRLGWLIHPRSLGPTLAMMIQYTHSGVTTFLQHAGVAALRDGEPFVESMRVYCQTGVSIVCDALDRLPRVRLGKRPVAGMYVFFQVDGMPHSREACLAILEKTRVGLAPGFFFGPGAESFLRICVCRSPQILTEAMKRLEPILI